MRTMSTYGSRAAASCVRTCGGGPTIAAPQLLAPPRAERIEYRKALAASLHAKAPDQQQEASEQPPDRETEQPPPPRDPPDTQPPQQAPVQRRRLRVGRRRGGHGVGGSVGVGGCACVGA